MQFNSTRFSYGGTSSSLSGTKQTYSPTRSSGHSGERTRDLSNILQQYQSGMSERKTESANQCKAQIQQLAERVPQMKDQLNENIENIRQHIRAQQNLIQSTQDSLSDYEHQTNETIVLLGERFESEMQNLYERHIQAHEALSHSINELSNKLYQQFSNQSQSGEAVAKLEETVKEEMQKANEKLMKIGETNAERMKRDVDSFASECKSLYTDLSDQKSKRDEIGTFLKQKLDEIAKQFKTQMNESKAERVENENAIVNMLEMACVKIEQSLSA
ncbi:hypothetical protein BLNAU_4524 [Blattamonas nauphoetae]|uniref:SF-assemblin n=1 Tax=Blattamonas nauphoetae TaxID=2049346 RepID=A0ABQ9YA13_9EUKA|nr:hypothetical protein BLNAU_4524 [Blattamonas nauphoetae]